MKNLFIAIVTFCISSSAFAQSTIEKDLQGLWKMSEMNVGGILANATTKEIKFTKELENKLTVEKRAAFNANKQAFLDKISGSRITFVGKKVNYSIVGTEKSGSYTLTPYAGAYILTVTEDGDVSVRETMVIAIVNDELHMVNNDDKDKAEMIFKKIVIE
jgi:hypothetical protein